MADYKSDLLVMRLMYEVPVTGMEYMSGTPPHMRLVGPDFRSVTKVLINGYEAPEIIIPTNTVVVAQLPEQAYEDRLRSLHVLSTGYLEGRSKALTRWDFGKKSKSVSGLQKLVQNYIRLLLKTPGSDIWDMESGGGLMSLIGTTTDADRKIISTAVMKAVINAEAQMKRMQAGRDIHPEETLLTAMLLGLSFSSEKTMVGVNVRLSNAAGRQGVASVSEIIDMVQKGSLTA